MSTLPVFASPTKALAPGEYMIDGFAFGSPQAINGITIQQTAIDPGTATVQDTTLVGVDGVQFGVDTMAGLVITFTGNVVINSGNLPAGQTPQQAALDAWNQLAGVWNNPAVRLNYGVMSQLRMRYPFSASTRTVYGRGRAIVPVMGWVKSGVIPFTAAFQSGDWVIYQDQVNSLNITMARLPPPFSAPLTAPVTVPYQSSFAQSSVLNSGSVSTWPVIMFRGPCSFPSLAYPLAGVSIGYNGQLIQGQTLVIDCRPWVRTAIVYGTTPTFFQVAAAGPLINTIGTPPPIILGGTASSVAGLLTGNRMADMSLPPGATPVQLTGTAQHGVSACTIYWQSAEIAIGGSVS